MFARVMIKVIFVLFFCMAISGCGKHCLSVAGDYQGVNGQVEYCFDSKKAEAGGVPAFNATGDGDKTTYYGFTEDQVVEIVEKLKEKVAGVSALSSPRPPRDPGKEKEKHPVRELREILEGKKPNAEHDKN